MGKKKNLKCLFESNHQLNRLVKHSKRCWTHSFCWICSYYNILTYPLYGFQVINPSEYNWWWWDSLFGGEDQKRNKQIYWSDQPIPSNFYKTEKSSFYKQGWSLILSLFIKEINVNQCIYHHLFSYVIFLVCSKQKVRVGMLPPIST